jgi:threonine dehydratase
VTAEASTLEAPTIEDVRAAEARIAPQLSLPTPLVASPALSELVGAEVLLKLEFANPVGVFKLRGGINLVSQLTATERASGLFTASTGNHGQSIAYAAGLFDAPAHIFAPEGSNPDKIGSIQRLGGEVTLTGARFDDAREACEVAARDRGARYVHSANEPALIAGCGVAALEVLERQRANVDVAIVPVGGGSGVCGWLTVRDGLSHAAEVWGVQSSAAPAAHDAFRARELLERDNETSAEGLATAVAFELTQRMMWESLDDFLLVHDAAIEDAVVTLLEEQHLLVEPAGAAALAGALTVRDRLAGRVVVLVLSGANITRDQLQAILDARR